MRALVAAAGICAAVALGEEPLVEVRLIARNAPDPPRPTMRVAAGEVVELREPGWWTPREPLPPSAETLPVWRTGVLSGRIALEDKESKLPETIDVIVEAPPPPAKQPEIPRGTKFLCPVAPGGTWSCSIPAITLDLVVRAGAFVPVYRWEVKVPPGGKRDLGAITLTKGSSVLAWLDPANLATLKEPARARLVRMLPPGSASETAARLSVPVAEAVFSSRGAVQLAPVPAGNWVLEVSARGLAPARVFPIDVYPGRETVLRRAVTLDPPLVLRVDIAPPVDSAGKPWQLSLVRLSDFSSSLDMATSRTLRANEAGEVSAADLVPGTYLATVTDSAGSSYFADKWRIDDPLSATRRIEVPLIHVRGTIRDGNRSLPATLWFGGRHGAVRVKMTSDDEGKFAGVLPRRGTWRVEVESAALPAATTVTADVEDGEDIEIDLPRTRLSGWVVDSSGAPAPRAVVTMLIDPTPLVARTDARGLFSFRGFPQAAFSLRARDSRGLEVAGPLRFESGPAVRDNVEIQLAATRQIAGRLVSRRGPVIGARILSYARPLAGEAVSATSDGDGRFAVRLPAAATRADFIVAAPGHALQAFEATVGDELVVLDVALQGGTLVLHAGAAGLRLTQNGAALPLHELLAWAEGHGLAREAGVPLRIPNLAPGAIRACVAAGPCAEGQLAAGGTLELDLRR